MFLFAVLYFSERVSFFRCVKGWREVHVHLTPRIYVIRWELFLCAYVFFLFSLTRMTPTSVVQWPLFQMLLINEKSISIFVKKLTVDFVSKMYVCVIWIKEKIRCIKMLMMHLTLFWLEIRMKFCILSIKIRFSISFQIHLPRMSPPSNLLFCSIICVVFFTTRIENFQSVVKNWARRKMHLTFTYNSSSLSSSFNTYI